TETLAWQRARDEEASTLLRGWRGWPALHDRLTARGSAGRAVAPIPAGGRWFHWSPNAGGGSRLEMSAPVDGPRRSVWTTDSSRQTVSAVFPAPNARYLAIGLAEGGDEWNGQLVVVD